MKSLEIDYKTVRLKLYHEGEVKSLEIDYKTVRLKLYHEGEVKSLEIDYKSPTYNSKGNLHYYRRLICHMKL